MRICLYGSGNKKIKKEYIEIGYDLGYELSKRNHTLVFGAGNHGMMGNVAKGVKENNGEIIGITPKWMEEFELPFKDCDKLIKTKSMDERKQLFLENSDGFIIAPGGIGTLDEFFEIITLKKLKQHNKPIVIFNINNYYNKMIEFLNFIEDEKFLYSDSLQFEVCESIDETLNYLERNNKK